jgi:hypothetical protein
MSDMRRDDLQEHRYEPGYVGTGSYGHQDRRFGETGYANGGHVQRSLGSLIVELTRELKELFVTEVELARTEVSTKIERAATGVGALVAGGAIALSGLMALVAAAIIGLDAAINELWLSALIVGVVVLAIGAALAMAGKNQMTAEKLAPKKTAENIREDARFLKQEVQQRRA